MSNPVNYIKERQFVSDNASGICPEAMQSMNEANSDHCPPYGDDIYTKKAADLLRDLFETDCEVFFVFNGTAANSLALSSLSQSYHSILCHEHAHIETDECGGPEFYSNGTKLLTLPGDLGKVQLQAIEERVYARSDLHYPKPRVVSITQATEVGTVYQPEELQEIGNLCKKLDLSIHMDGARFSNAVASLNVAPKEITWKAGVDVLCFGGTKNGLAIGEAVIFFNKKLAYEFEYRCKQAGQLCSKMRFLAAPWLGMLESGAWLKHAGHANYCASLIAEKASELKDIQPAFPVEANAAFIEMPERTKLYLKEQGWHFYDFIGANIARFMCSWDTREEDVLQLVEDIRTSLP